MASQTSDVRKPPIGAVISQHKQGVRGLCGWCGLAVEEKTEVRGYLKFWHGACSFEMGVIGQPALARDAVFKRDKGICTDCGEDWSEMSLFRPAFLVPAERAIGDSARYSAAPKPGTFCQISHECSDWDVPRDQREYYPYVPLLVVSLWHVDHRVPLWKVRHLPDLKRLEYFKLANLITRCHRCHAFKTKKEAAERAKYDRRDTPADPSKAKPKWRKRPAGSGNGFPPKGSTPMRRKI